MEDARMVKMFKSLETTGLRGFLGVSGSVFEGALTQFFSNTSMIAGTIISIVANRNMVITMDVFAESFQLLTEGMIILLGLPVQAITDIKVLFSAKAAPFKPSNKKNDMKVEYRLLNDIEPMVSTMVGLVGTVWTWGLSSRKGSGSGGRIRDNEYCGSLRQSGPRPEPRLLRQAALEALTRSARTNTPRKTRPEQFSAKIVGCGGGAWAAAAEA
ncbi:hypothetical protein F511_25745 [Dorcoceras hygrometricum]|uniref:Uncharacterized protein n=1 Tax=Dorcoceras hygrometricum TaxID=472368 RepID=A0A2Z7BXQ5_9LAMI|nr:hypothetical protein F511_25745 [Dorcoceras hygrometricum]